MDNSLPALCHALKKIFWQLKPYQNPLSFILVTGKQAQGKTTLLRQSQLKHVTIEAECPAEVYYNEHGVVVELGEAWLSQSKNLLEHTLKQLNRCHRAITITGMILCIDVQELLHLEPNGSAEQITTHGQLLKRFGTSLGYPVDLAVIFTKMDSVAGFCDFFQTDHASELSKPLGFSIHTAIQQGKTSINYKTQFDQFVEMLSQQVISKIHPARSSLKRTLIREFPLQIASLKTSVQSLLQPISPQLFRIQALYWTSAEQGGVSHDRINQKIKQEYALTVQDKIPQANNYRKYFVDGAMLAFQMQTKKRARRIAFSHQWMIGLLASAATISAVWIGYHHIQSLQILDEASKELLLFESLSKQQDDNATPALYHLTKAYHSLNKINANVLTLPSIQDLQNRMSINTKQHIQGTFVPELLAEIEQTMMDSRQSHAARYQALKIYLMLNSPEKFIQRDVLTWLKSHWHNEQPQVLQKKLTLAKQVLNYPLQPITINQQVVLDVRNYLNALPPSYLFYSMAKEYFPKQQAPLSIDGFELANMALPIYFTKAGFQQVMKLLPDISVQLQQDNWVLARQDLQELPTLLQQAYCYEYGIWWQNFMHHSKPKHFQSYEQARNITQQLQQQKSIETLVTLIQNETSPEFGEHATLFNQEIASKFTTLSLVSNSAVESLSRNLSDLEKFLTTLSVVHDHGKTAFTITKSRFMGDTLSNPLSTLYTQSQQLADPLSFWMKQLADDTWFILINDSRTFINQQWQQTVFQEYQQHIAERYPFDANKPQDVTLSDFEHFFSNHGVLHVFFETYLKPFIDTSQPQWQLKEANNYVLPISSDLINELIRANVITNMFFPEQRDKTEIEFTLEKLNLDPIVASIQLTLGHTKLFDNQNSDSFTRFRWPEANAKLAINSIEGDHFELAEQGAWAFFKMLQKVNVLVDERDSSNLQILFEVNGNSGRYLLKTENQINPFTPGILNGFSLTEVIV